MSTVTIAANNKEFQTRLKKVAKRRNSKLSAGYLSSNNHDGLVVAHVRRPEGNSILSGLLFAIVLVVVAKSVAVASIGEAGYHDRIARLAAGTSSERMAAVTLQADPLTSAIAAWIAPYIK